MSKEEIDFITTEDEDPFRRRRAKNRSNDLKTPRQKYCARWEQSFPWLKADKIDECLGVCTICDKRLVCKKSHLERHQNSNKHQNAMGYEVIVSKSETDEMPIDNDKDGDEGEGEFQEFEIEHVEMDHSNEVESSSEVTPIIKKVQQKKLMTAKGRAAKARARSPIVIDSKADVLRLRLLNRINKERKELNEYYYSRQKAPAFSSSPPVQRDTFDLFFDSISASVKALPLKLGYEFKSKVSQLLTEFELRALCEKEAEEKAANYPNTSTPVIVTPAFDESSKPIINSVTPVIYSFQAK